MLYNNVRDALSKAARYASDFRNPNVHLEVHRDGINVCAVYKQRTFLHKVDHVWEQVVSWEYMGDYVGDSLLLDTIDGCVDKLHIYMSDEERSAWRIIKHVWGCR